MATVNLNLQRQGTVSNIGNNDSKVKSAKTFNLSTPVQTIERLVTVTTQVEVEAPVSYVKRGFNVSTSQFEFWRTQNPGAAAPSGNSLIDVTIVATYR